MSDRILSYSFGNRQPLSCDSREFAARSRRLQDVLGALAAESTQSVSIFGPHRSGKSSLLQQLSSRTELSRYPTLSNATVIQADFLPYRGRARDALKHLVDEIACAVGQLPLQSDSVRVAPSVADAVTRALGALPGRLVIAIDNFEAVGSDLKREHQADLHAAVYKKPRAGFVLASRLPLFRCLEEFGDPLSDLAPIFVPAPDCLRPLSKNEISELIAAGAPLLDSQTRAALADLVHRRVGGFALWVQQALGTIFRREINSDSVVAEAQKTLEHELVGVLEPDLYLGYRKLPSNLRRFIDDRAVGQSIEEEGPGAAELELSGWCVPGISEFRFSCTLVEEWVRLTESKRASARKQNRDAEVYFQLLDAVDRLNRKHQIAFKRREWVIRPDVFHQSRDAARLRRRVLNEEDFGLLVLTLARLLYEGSGGGVKNAKLTLPQAYYDDRRSIVYCVSQLRHDYIHLESPDSKAESRKLNTQSELFNAVLSGPPTSPEDFERLATALLERAIEQVEALVDKWPSPMDVPPDHFFGSDP